MWGGQALLRLLPRVAFALADGASTDDKLKCMIMRLSMRNWSLTLDWHVAGARLAWGPQRAAADVSLLLQVHGEEGGGALLQGLQHRLLPSVPYPRAPLAPAGRAQVCPHLKGHFQTGRAESTVGVFWSHQRCDLLIHKQGTF